VSTTKTALVTGATSGLGASFASYLARQGYDLILTGRRKKKIEALAAVLREDYNISVTIVLAEFTSDKDIQKVINTMRDCTTIDVLVNNAGYGNAKDFLSDTCNAQERMIKVHIIAPVRLMHAAVPRMIQQGSGMVINVSSLAAFTVGPGRAMYCSTKAFLRTVTESLHTDVHEYNIHVQALCPGFTRTDFHEKLSWSADKLKNRGIARWMTADEVVRKSFKNIRKRRIVYIPGFWNKMIYYVILIIPRRIYYLLASKYSHNL
jgi:uncharacterized protein